VSEHPRSRENSAAISSSNNERIRFVRTLYRTSVRRKERLFVVEGVRLVETALAAGAIPELVLVAPEQLARTERGAALLEQLAAFPTVTVTDSVLKTLSDTVTPQGVIAVLPVPAPPAHPRLNPMTLILDGLRDPGNVGTLLRSAEASGMVHTVALVDSVDAYAPKVVRAAMGAHFRLTLLDDAEWSRLLPLLGHHPRYLAVAEGGVPYDQVDWRQDSVLILGGEAEGAGEAAVAAATQQITVPMVGPAESLNAAMAGTVVLFEAARVRRAAGETPTSHSPAAAETTSPIGPSEASPPARIVGPPPVPARVIGPQGTPPGRIVGPPGSPTGTGGPPGTPPGRRVGPPGAPPTRTGGPPGAPPNRYAGPPRTGPPSGPERRPPFRGGPRPPLSDRPERRPTGGRPGGTGESGPPSRPRPPGGKPPFRTGGPPGRHEGPPGGFRSPRPGGPSGRRPPGPAGETPRGHGLPRDPGKRPPRGRSVPPKRDDS
jgi:TrmH family RNA methyltransferase